MRVGRNLITSAIKPPKEGGGGVLNNVYFILFLFMSRGSALRSNPSAFRILFWTKKGPPSYYLLLPNETPVHMTIVELCIPCNCNKCPFF